MKNFALVASVLIAACATTRQSTPGREASSSQLEEKSRQIAARARQCVDGAVEHTNDEIIGVAAAPDASTDLRVQLARNQGEQAISQCKAEAERESEELSSQQRTDYQLRAQQERDRGALMMTLTTSMPH